MTRNSKTTFAALSAAVALGVTAPLAQAKFASPDDTRVQLRHGADDAARKSNVVRAARGREAEPRRGADDRAGHDARARHAEARNGADDPAGDDRGRRGGDDGPRHG